MSMHDSQTDAGLSSTTIMTSPNHGQCCKFRLVSWGISIGAVATLLLGAAFMIGRQSVVVVENTTRSNELWHGLPLSKVPPEVLNATASHGSENLAVCTGRVDEDSEGFFSLDFITGNLQGWVYYPRTGQFGGMFMTNVQSTLGSSKNPQYLMVTGEVMPGPSGGNVRAASCLIYVVDARSGFFAAYTIPWDRSRESSNVGQMGQFILAGGGQIRESGAGAKKPMTPPAVGANAPKKPGDPVPPAANPTDPKADPKNKK
jgi:hypothetical protein